IWQHFMQTGETYVDDKKNDHKAVGEIIDSPTNGLPQLKVYPDGPFQGAFNLLDVGPPSNNTPAFRNWIDNGETSNDIKYLLDNSLLPVSMQGPKSWKDGPGLSDTLIAN